MPALPEISPSTMYLVLNLGVLPFWALLIFLPHARITETLVHSVMMPLILGVTYAWLLATALGNKLLFIGSYFWGKLDLWQLWAIFIVCCLLSAAFIFSIMKRLENATK